jgi:hypothetical protein
MPAARSSAHARRRHCVTPICSNRVSTLDKDEVYADLARHFSDEEIIELGLFCAEVDGVGKFVKSLSVLSWEEACELNPRLSAASTPRVAAE